VIHISAVEKTNDILTKLNGCVNFSREKMQLFEIWNRIFPSLINSMTLETDLYKKISLECGLKLHSSFFNS